MSAAIHVVSKDDNRQHSVCLIDESNTLQPLPPSAVRVQTLLISLTSVNLTYAQNGGVLHWWDVYPVPEHAPPPFNDNQAWGIVPAWGYGRVTESNIPEIPQGSNLWGMWPTSSHQITLQLKASSVPGRWTEHSSHRGRLMTVYNQYEQVKADIARDEMHASVLFKVLFGAAHLLSRSTFSPLRIHPLGTGNPWSEKDADLTSAVVISLSASTKTGRNFHWVLTKERDVQTSGPLALLQLTSAPDALSTDHGLLPTKTAHYTEKDALNWVEQFRPSRIVIVDFGAADAVVESTASEALKITDSVTVVAVGREAKLYTKAEVEATQAIHKALGKVQLNTSPLRDRTMEVVGAQEYVSEVNESWARCLAERGFGDVKVLVFNGVDGTDGIHGAWERLCERKVAVDAGIVVELATS